jgi:hypothetical protein
MNGTVEIQDKPQSQITSNTSSQMMYGISAAPSTMTVVSSDGQVPQASYQLSTVERIASLEQEIFALRAKQAGKPVFDGVEIVRPRKISAKQAEPPTKSTPTTSSPVPAQPTTSSDTANDEASQTTPHQHQQRLLPLRIQILQQSLQNNLRFTPLPKPAKLIIFLRTNETSLHQLRSPKTRTPHIVLKHLSKIRR